MGESNGVINAASSYKKKLFSSVLPLLSFFASLTKFVGRQYKHINDMI